jgi:hypothetical protein
LACEGDKFFYGDCGLLETQTVGEWCTYLGQDRCFAPNADACCEPNVTRLALLTLLFTVGIVFFILASCATFGCCPFYPVSPRFAFACGGASV